MSGSEFRHEQKRDADAAVETATTGTGSSASGTTTVAAPASATQSPLGQGRQGASRGIAEGTQRREQHRQEDVNPLIGFAVIHVEQAPLIMYPEIWTSE
jgi:hypothetical protein